jgi:hypothetical protein
MRPGSHVRFTPRMEAAVHELQGLITARFPQAAFVVEEGGDPKGLSLVTTVDSADTDEVTAVVGDQLVALQADEGLPGYVAPPCGRSSASSRHCGSGRRPRRWRLYRSHERTSHRQGLFLKRGWFQRPLAGRWYPVSSCQSNTPSEDTASLDIPSVVRAGRVAQ